MANLSKSGRWLIRAHHFMRVCSFGAVFVASCLHIVGKNYGPAAWTYLVALLLVYPQLLYWRTLRADDGVRTTMNALMVDSLLLGAYCATVEFADWLSYSVVLAALSNFAANKGWRSSAVCLLALFAGALLGVVVGGWHFSPRTEWPTAAFCMLGLGAYVVAVGNIAFSRNQQLRIVREQLRSHERDLLAANATLHTNLAEIEILKTGLLEQANQDGLTKLFNRRFLDSTLERELARCKRESKPLALIMVDIDHFKKYNDCYGHQAGDECLKAVSSVLQRSAKRAGDLAARYGGEEFSLVLPDTDGVDALRMAEELRQQIQNMAMPHAQSDLGQVTISAGLAVMANQNYATAEQLLRAADEALYYAKWGGRNRVHAAAEVSKPASLDGLASDLGLPLAWHFDYASGNASIDAQHEQLFGQINEVYKAVTATHSSDALRALIDKLMHSVVAHLEHEEGMLKEIGFPGTPDHVAEHRVLMRRAVELVSQHRNGNLRMGDLLRFLAHDLIGKHVLVSDRKYFRYLRA